LSTIQLLSFSTVQELYRWNYRSPLLLETISHLGADGLCLATLPISQVMLVYQHSELAAHQVYVHHNSQRCLTNSGSTTCNHSGSGNHILQYLFKGRTTLKNTKQRIYNASNILQICSIFQL